MPGIAQRGWTVLLPLSPDAVPLAPPATPQGLQPRSLLPGQCHGGKYDFAKLFDNKREPLNLRGPRVSVCSSVTLMK